MSGYGVVARPLTNILKKDKFNWGETAEMAFQELNIAMSSTPVFALPDFAIPYIIETDVCYGRLGLY